MNFKEEVEKVIKQGVKITPDQKKDIDVLSQLFRKEPGTEKKQPVRAT